MPDYEFQIYYPGNICVKYGSIYGYYVQDNNTLKGTGYGYDYLSVVSWLRSKGIMDYSFGKLSQLNQLVAKQ